MGLEGDLVYIVSDFVEGLSLGDRLTGKRMTHHDAAALALKIAEVLHFAHEKGVVHRDLKPSNIMLDGAGEPHLMDFGLARREMGEITMTTQGQIVGTPAYMSPEQARGEAHVADRRSDIYSLGVILFELLTGERPFRGNVRMLIKQVIEDEAPGPGRSTPAFRAWRRSAPAAWRRTPAGTTPRPASWPPTCGTIWRASRSVPAPWATPSGCGDGASAVRWWQGSRPPPPCCCC